MAGAPRSTRRSRDASTPSGDDRRSEGRVEVTWSVDCETEDTFLYASIANISAMGIFVRTESPLEPGTSLQLRFAPVTGVPGAPLTARSTLLLKGVVQWVNPVRLGGDNPNPGMGIRFVDLDLPTRELLVEAVRSIAYLREDVAVGD
jgi:type IV pilus assembly protein PilZ